MGKNANKRKTPKEPAQRLAQTSLHIGIHNPWGQRKLGATPSHDALPTLPEHNGSTFLEAARGFFSSKAGRIASTLGALALFGVIATQFLRH